jgi:hypothetical protein
MNSRFIVQNPLRKSLVEVIDLLISYFKLEADIEKADQTNKMSKVFLSLETAP